MYCITRVWRRFGAPQGLLWSVRRKVCSPARSRICVHVRDLHRDFANDLSDKTFINLTGKENDEGVREKELGGDFGAMLFAHDIDANAVRWQRCLLA